MVRDAVRGYWALASGLTEVTRQRATAAARALVSQGEATAEQVGAIAEDLISTSLANRGALVAIVRHEVDRARSAVGVVGAVDLQALEARIDALSSEVAALRAAAPATRTTAPKRAPAKPAAATKTPAKKTAKTPAKKTATPAKKTAKTPAKKTAVKKTAPTARATS